jgi:hypothetical protein
MFVGMSCQQFSRLKEARIADILVHPFNSKNMEQFLKYYGLDWLAMSLSLLAVYLLGNKNKYGFLSFLVANATWVFLGFVMMNSLGIGIGNIVFLIMNIRGYLSWDKK